MDKKAAKFLYNKGEHMDSNWEKQQESVEIPRKKNPELAAPKKRSFLKWIGICGSVIVLCFVFFIVYALLSNPVGSPPTKCVLPSNFIDSSDNTITRTFPYFVNGQEGSVTVTLNKKLRDYWACRSDEIRPQSGWNHRMYCDFGGCRYTNFYMISELLNENKKYSSLKPLVDAIKSKSDDPEMQARIAVNLVQHIPYSCTDYQIYTNSNYNYHYHFTSPYEAIYENDAGMCYEKAVLLASLLNELGYDSAVLIFLNETHATAGIRGSVIDQYLNTGYINVESTIPSPIGFSKTTSTPDVIGLPGKYKFSLNNQDRIDSKNFQTILINPNEVIQSPVDPLLLNNLEMKYGEVHTMKKCFNN